MIPFVGCDALQSGASSRQRRADVMPTQNHDLFQRVKIPEILGTLGLGDGGAKRHYQS